MLSISRNSLVVYTFSSEATSCHVFSQCRHFFQEVMSVKTNKRVPSGVMKERERTTGRLCWCSVGVKTLLWSSQADDKSEESGGGGGAKTDEKKKHFKYCLTLTL